MEGKEQKETVIESTRAELLLTDEKPINSLKSYSIIDTQKVNSNPSIKTTTSGNRYV